MNEAAKVMSVQPTATALIDPVRVFGGMSTRSRKMRVSLSMLELLAPTELSLLIEGETGVGKELAAESVHRASSRSDRPFIVFDCAATSPAVGERELFGTQDESPLSDEGMSGVLELAHGGTLFLDHVDELVAPLQNRLQRVLERRQHRRVGGTQSIALDLRVISACTRSLRQNVRLGAFSPELYLQVGAECIRIPPLRERLEDLLPLAQEFLASFHPAAVPGDIPEHVWSAFRDYQWPGNVRELRNALQRALLVPERALRFSRGLK